MGPPPERLLPASRRFQLPPVRQLHRRTGNHQHLPRQSSLQREERCLPVARRRRPLWMRPRRDLEDGFSCPLEKQFNPDGTAEAHPRYPHPTNCQKFYICLNGITPRETGCATGEVYNSDSKQCDQPENVEDCATWYDDVESPATAA